MTTPASPLRERLRRIVPYFASSRRGFAIALAGSVIGAMTEPLIPLLLKWLLDAGFQLGGVPLWSVPLAVVGLTVVRGAAGFVAQYGMAWAANRELSQFASERLARMKVLTLEPNATDGMLNAAIEAALHRVPAGAAGTTDAAVTASPDAPPSNNLDHVMRGLAESARLICGTAGAAVYVKAHGEIPRSQGKAVRVKDLRKK